MQGGGITATGFNIWETQHYQGYRVMAAPPSYPFYTILEVTYSDGTTFQGVVLDRGGAIQGELFDVAVSDYQTAMQMGRKTGTVRIIGSLT